MANPLTVVSRSARRGRCCLPTVACVWQARPAHSVLATEMIHLGSVVCHLAMHPSSPQNGSYGRVITSRSVNVTNRSSSGKNKFPPKTLGNWGGWTEAMCWAVGILGGLLMELLLISGDDWLFYQRDRTIRRLMDLRNRLIARESLLPLLCLCCSTIASRPRGDWLIFAPNILCNHSIRPHKGRASYTNTMQDSQEISIRLED